MKFPTSKYLQRAAMITQRLELMASKGNLLHWVNSLGIPMYALPSSAASPEISEIIRGQEQTWRIQSRRLNKTLGIGSQCSLFTEPEMCEQQRRIARTCKKLAAALTTSCNQYDAVDALVALSKVLNPTLAAQDRIQQAKLGGVLRNVKKCLTTE